MIISIKLLNNNSEPQTKMKFRKGALKMVRKVVSSSNFISIGYNNQEKILEVEFFDGKVYQYFGVPKRIHDELMKARSLGSYHFKNIRSNFQHARIE